MKNVPPPGMTVTSTVPGPGVVSCASACPDPNSVSAATNDAMYRFMSASSMMTVCVTAALEGKGSADARATKESVFPAASRVRHTGSVRRYEQGDDPCAPGIHFAPHASKRGAMSMIAEAIDLNPLDAFHALLPTLAQALDVRDIFQRLSAVASEIVPHDE